MKKFLAGFFASFFLVAGVLFFVFVYENKTELKPNNTRLLELDPQAEDLIVFSGTFVVPPELQHAVKNGTGTMHYFLMSVVRQKNLFNTIPQSFQSVENPTFPFDFKFSIPRKLLEKEPWAHLEVKANYFPGGATLKDSVRLGAISKPFLRATRGLDLTKEQIAPRAAPIHFEKVPFIRNQLAPPKDFCASAKVLLAGTITPSPTSKKDWRKMRVALIVTEWDIRKDEIVSKKLLPDQLEKLNFHYQLLDFSKGSAPFSIPVKSISSPYVRTFAIECKPGEDLKFCAASIFPFNVNPERKLFIIPKDYAVAMCGMTHFEGIIGEDIETALPTDIIINSFSP